MKIVVLDGYVLNPGDLSWSGINELGNCIIFALTLRGQFLKPEPGK